eukprot:Skav225598  [mRNA]  locus=scaffold1399:194779:199088:- [translate_table: standard]
MGRARTLRDRGFLFDAPPPISLSPPEDDGFWAESMHPANLAATAALHQALGLGVAPPAPLAPLAPLAPVAPVAPGLSAYPDLGPVVPQAWPLDVPAPVVEPQPRVVEPEVLEPQPKVVEQCEAEGLMGRGTGSSFG